jgi:hypothetical protein
VCVCLFVCVCVCMDFVMCVCMCGFCNVWLSRQLCGCIGNMYSYLYLLCFLIVSFMYIYSYLLLV